MVFIYGIYGIYLWNLWKRDRRSTCEGGNSKLIRNIQQDIKNRYKKNIRGEKKHKKMAKPMGGNNERSDN